MQERNSNWRIWSADIQHFQHYWLLPIQVSAWMQYVAFINVIDKGFFSNKGT